MLKLPVVFQHFAEHQQENKNISFIRFLDMHYMHGSPKDKDYDRDMQLPFKTSDSPAGIGVISFVPAMPQIAVTKPVEILQIKRTVQKAPFMLTPCLSKIWQPPKSC